MYCARQGLILQRFAGHSQAVSICAETQGYMHSQPLSEANWKTKNIKLTEAITRSQAFPPHQNKYRQQSICKEKGFVLALTVWKGFAPDQLFLLFGGFGRAAHHNGTGGVVEQSHTPQGQEEKRNQERAEATISLKGRPRWPTHVPHKSFPGDQAPNLRVLRAC